MREQWNLDMWYLSARLQSLSRNQVSEERVVRQGRCLESRCWTHVSVWVGPRLCIRPLHLLSKLVPPWICLREEGLEGLPVHDVSPATVNTLKSLSCGFGGKVTWFERTCNVPWSSRMCSDIRWSGQSRLAPWMRALWCRPSTFWVDGVSEMYHPSWWSIITWVMILAMCPLWSNEARAKWVVLGCASRTGG